MRVRPLGDVGGIIDSLLRDSSVVPSLYREGTYKHACKLSRGSLYNLAYKSKEVYYVLMETPVTTRFRLADILTTSGAPMSQSELSRRSGISMTTINAMVLNKTKQVSLATLDAISAALGVDPGALLEREPKKKGRAR